MNARRDGWVALVLALALLVGGLVPAQAEPLSYLFTYQGQLQQSGSAVNGTCDFQFSLWDAAGSGSPPAGGNQIGSTQAAGGWPVTDGLFTLPLGFGFDAFTGVARWLQIAVRCPDGSGPYTTLSPRQALTAAPYALYAPSAGSAGDLSCMGCVGPGDLASGAVTSSKIATGTIQTSNLAFTPGSLTSITAGTGLTGGTITTNGTIAANIGTTAGTVAAGDHTHDNAYWSLTGNGSTSAGADFLGTTNNQALELKANNTRALRLEPNDHSPNLIGGHFGNTVTDGAVGATIGGGGLGGEVNRVTDDYGTIGGGSGNQAGDGAGRTDDRIYATVSGGWSNVASSDGTAIGGGVQNAASASYATIGGGLRNSADALFATVGGGQANRAAGGYATIAGGGQSDPNDTATGNRATDNYATVGGGGNNQAGNNSGGAADAEYATVSGGGGNRASAQGATVAGGGGNQATGLYATVGGGVFNSAVADHATVPGGSGNIASGAGSFAAGRLSLAAHVGSFVWGDGTRIAGSQGPNTFNVLATGGMRFYFDAIGNHCDLVSTAGWNCAGASDRNAKRNFSSVDSREVLTRLATVPMQRWSYKSQDPAIQHIGPMAQDFGAAFQVGEDDTHINTVDAEGVALAAIQGLYALAREQAARIAAQEKTIVALQTQNDHLHARVTAVEEHLAKITRRQETGGWEVASGE